MTRRELDVRSMRGLRQRFQRAALAWAPAWLAARWHRLSAEQRRLYFTWVRNTALGVIVGSIAAAGPVVVASYLYESWFAALMSVTYGPIRQAAWTAAVVGVCVGAAQAMVLRQIGRWRKWSLWWPLVTAAAFTGAEVAFAALNAIPLSERFGERALTFSDVLPSGLWRLITVALTGGVAGLFQALFLVASAAPPLLDGTRATRAWAAANALGSVAVVCFGVLVRALGTVPEAWPWPVALAFGLAFAVPMATLGGAVLALPTGALLVTMVSDAPPLAARRVLQLRDLPSRLRRRRVLRA